MACKEGVEFYNFKLKEKLLQGIYDKGFDKPSPIQEECIPRVIDSRHLQRFLFLSLSRLSSATVFCHFNLIRAADLCPAIASASARASHLPPKHNDAYFSAAKTGAQTKISLQDRKTGPEKRQPLLFPFSRKSTQSQMQCRRLFSYPPESWLFRCQPLSKNSESTLKSNQWSLPEARWSRRISTGSIKEYTSLWVIFLLRTSHACSMEAGLALAHRVIPGHLLPRCGQINQLSAWRPDGGNDMS